MRYKYCPQCGEKLILKEAGDDGDTPFCNVCGHFWFDTFADCSIILVANEFREIALLRQSYLSDKYCTFVSGYIKPGETAEETAYREVEEEIGLKLESLENCGTFWFPRNEILMHGFIGYVKKAPFRLSSEVDSAEWTPAAEVKDKIFPDLPGNTAFALYKLYLNKA